MKITNLNWGQRLALIEHYRPTDVQIVDAMKVSQDELDSARKLLMSGEVRLSTTIDVEQYATAFVGSPTNATVQPIPAPVRDATKSATSTMVPLERAQSASRPTRPPKKRGRKGSNVSEAYRAIPNVKVELTAFLQTHGVSEHVMRQSKRFDLFKDTGQVRVRKDADNGKLMIWRELPEEKAPNT